MTISAESLFGPLHTGDDDSPIVMNDQACPCQLPYAAADRFPGQSRQLRQASSGHFGRQRDAALIGDSKILGEIKETTQNASTCIQTSPHSELVLNGMHLRAELLEQRGEQFRLHRDRFQQSGRPDTEECRLHQSLDRA